jgi:hypothetical protein
MRVRDQKWVSSQSFNLYIGEIICLSFINYAPHESDFELLNKDQLLLDRDKHWPSAARPHRCGYLNESRYHFQWMRNAAPTYNWGTSRLRTAFITQRRSG